MANLQSTEKFTLESTAKPLGGMTILVVEDEFLIALEAQRMLEDAGAEFVLLANSIGDVHKLLADGPPIDASILDLKLGGEDASPLILEFSQRSIPFFVTTGFDAVAPEGIRVLAKPYRETEFIDAILEMIHRPK